MIKETVKLNYLRISPRKVRLVAGLLKGLPVTDAEAQLMYERRRAAKPLLKLLRSAVANAKNNRKWDPEKLKVENVRVDKGPIMSGTTYLPRARGMATPIQRIMSHVTLTVIEADVKPRFTITTRKKTKKPSPVAKAPKKKPDHERESHVEGKPRSSGFFRRVFNRKSV